MAVISPGRKQWYHPKATFYQHRMKKRPTRSERRFDDILDDALKGFTLSVFNGTQVTYSTWHRKKRKFKKQRIFEDKKRKKAYLIDFYIPDLLLAIELDGPSHDTEKAREYDAIRTSFLGTRGIKVIRFRNEETLDVESCKKSVINQITTRIHELKARHHQGSSEISSDPPTDLKSMVSAYLDKGGMIIQCPKF